METTSLVEGARELLPMVVEAGWKGSLLVVVLLGLARLFRRAPAATRHLLWAGGLVALVAMPVLSAAVPWRLDVVPVLASAAAGESLGGEPAPAALLVSSVPSGGALDALGAGVPHRTGEEAADRAAGDPSSEPAGAVEGPARRVDLATRLAGLGSAGWSAMAALVWLAGMAVIGLKVAAGWGLVWRLVRRASPLTDDAWAGELLRASERVGLSRPVRLLRSEGAQVAFTTGLLRPVVVLPAGCEEWTAERRRAVLMHELAHVRRGDLATHLLGRAACALHWFNPLAWLAAKRLRAESERACDDLVLTLGTRASDYAGHLLDLVRSAGRLRAPAVVVPMAQESEFEGRLLAILEPGVRRSRPSGAAAAAILAAVALSAVPLAALGPAGPREAGSRQASVAPAEIETGGRVPAATGTSDARGPDAAADRQEPAAQDLADLQPPQGEGAQPDPRPERPERQEQPEQPMQPEQPAQEAGATSSDSQARDPGRDRTRNVVAALASVLADPDAGVRRVAVQQLGQLQDTMAVAALMLALTRDEDPEVRSMAAWSLGQLESPRAIPALSQALVEDAVAEVRSRAAWALGQIEDEAAVPALVRGLEDADLEVRRQAAWALGQIESPAAVPGLTTLLDDQDAETRRHAVWALGQIEDPAAVEALAGLVDDPDAEVRQRAVWALGQIEDPRAAPALARALQDELPEVRRHAAAALADLGLGTAPEALIAAAADPEPEVRRVVAHALAEIADPASVPALRALLSDESPHVRRSALRGLGEIGTDAAIQAMVEALTDPDAEVRREAARALGEAGGGV